MSDLSVVETGMSRSDRRRFLNAGLHLYEGDRFRVQPLWSDWLRHTDPGRNPMFQHAQVHHLVLRKGRRDVGRVAVVRNRRSEEFRGDRTGWFGFFECPDDGEAFATLLGVAKRHLADMGCDRLLGPASYTTNDECGVLVEGFDGPPALMMPWNPPWYDRRLCEAGLQPEETLLAWFLHGKDMAADRYGRIMERARTRHGWTLRTLRMDRFDQEMDAIRAIYNAAWESNWGFVPMTDGEFRFAAEGLRPVIVPELVLVAEHEGRPVGFSLTIPDLNEVLIHLKGRLFPFGWWTAWRRSRTVRNVRVIALGVLPSHRGQGIDAALYLRTMEAASARGQPQGECSWTLERNFSMNRALEAMGARVYRRYRLYSATLAETIPEMDRSIES